MRIAIFTNNYLPNPYGVSTSVDGFYHGLTALGHEVNIFAPHWPQDEEYSSPNIFRYPSIAVPTKIPFSLALPFSPEIDKVIDAKEFDIIHAQHPNILGTQARRWARKKGVPLVFTWHSRYDHYTHYASLIPQNIASKWVMHNAQSFAVESDHVIFPTQSAFDLYKDVIGDAEVSIVSSGVDEDLFSSPEPEQIRVYYNIPPGAPLLVTVSRLTQEKNILFLARAVRRFLHNHQDVYFLVCGDGDLRSDAEALFHDSGVAASDVFVYASTTETQGTIVTEAMYSGVPIVAVRSSGVQDVVEDGVSGILVRESWGDFVYALEKVVYDEDYRKMLGGAAYERAHDDFTVTACTQKLVDVYKKVLE
jgi:1,2-diacylglycerol 3-alpha-glucosyltransferase